MARKQYNEDEVLYSLRNKKDLKITRDKEIFLLGGNSKIANHDVGNGSLGKIDYLTKKCGYRLYMVSQLP